MPRQISNTHKIVVPIILILVLALLAAAPLFAPRYTIILMISIFMYVIITVSWTMFSGPTGYVSLASAAFFGAGVYTSALFGLKLPLPVIVPLGGLAGFVLALLVGALTLRLKGAYFVMFTFGLVELLLNFLLWWEINITGTTGRVVPSVSNSAVYYTMLGIFVAVVGASYLINRSRYGLAMRCIGEYEEAAAHTGINVALYKIITFALSAFFMGAAGAIMATRWTYIDPHIAFNPLISFLPVLMAIFGGIGHLVGPIIGATIFTYLEEVLITKFPYYYMLIFGIIMLLAIIYLPEGVVGLFQNLYKRLTGKKNGAA